MDETSRVETRPPAPEEQVGEAASGRAPSGRWPVLSVLSGRPLAALRVAAQPGGWLRRAAVRLVALGVMLVLWAGARLPTVPAGERAEMASRFAFEEYPLPVPEGLARKGVRQVHPSLAHISAWISSVGASVALADLDGDGLPNDLCYVDNGTDRVVVTPAPGSGERYPLFTLEPTPLPWDAATAAPMGCLPGDLNEDGATDVLVYYWGRTPVAFLQRAAGGAEVPGTFPASVPGTFSGIRLHPGAFRPVEVAAEVERWHTNAATRADVDGDGHADLILGNYFQDGARILDPRGSGSEEMQHSMSRAANAGRNRIFLWAGGESGAAGAPSVRFEEAEGALPGRAELGWTLSVGAADLDGDLLPEIYLGNDFGPDRLLHNRSRPGKVRLVSLEGRRGFTDPRSKVLGHDSFKGMGVDFGDLDGDGGLDLYVSNIAEEFALEESHFLWLSAGGPEAMARAMRGGVAPYSDESEALGLSRSGWGWDSRLADFDNDGDLEAVQATGFVKGEVDRWAELHEIAMGNDDLLHNPAAWHRFEPGDDVSGDLHNPFFVRSEGGRFVDLAPELGLDRPMVSRGIATADVDGDGDLDLALGNQWETSYLWENVSPVTGGPRGRSLVLELLRGGLGGAWTPAVGATVEVRLPPQGSREGRVLVGQVDGGNGHSGARSHQVHFGLGAVGTAEELPVEVAWRDRRGRVHRLRLELTPGYHVVKLGEVGSEEAPERDRRPTEEPPKTAQRSAGATAGEGR